MSREAEGSTSNGLRTAWSARPSARAPAVSIQGSTSGRSEASTSSRRPGLVVRAGEVPGYDGYGNVVVVDAGGGFTTIYAHLDRPLARRGAFVTRGQKIGIAGCTGWCTGTHLHFELREQGRPVDPFLLLTLGYTAPTQGG